MRFQPLLSTLAFFFLFSSVVSAAEESSAAHPPSSDLVQPSSKRDEHGHHHAGVAPLLQLNETEVALHHPATPPSYYTIDWEDPDQGSDRHPGLIITHAVFMFLAFFVFLPIGITMRSAEHPLHGVAVFAFYSSFVLACAASSVYRKLTPDMYPNASHARQGYYVLFIALAVTLIDTLGVICRIVRFVRSAKHYTLKGFAQALLDRQDSDQRADSEYIRLIGACAEVDPADEVKSHRHSYHNSDFPSAEDFDYRASEQPAHVRLDSVASDPTRCGPSFPLMHETQPDISSTPRIPLLRRIGRAAFAATERALVFAGFALLLTGIVIYTGGCRSNYLNNCLAHLISNGIFWSYGLISFARYLGWNSERGWSWNRTALGSSGYPTAEFVESFLIFLYGATNTWMERFGANPGDPYTTKQIQHIAIAVMFWFGGLVGMAMESKSIRRWLAALASNDSRPVVEPATYAASFNPFPALVVGVTGAVMAAHFQTYLFQVQIHALWGNLLVAFAVLRCLTYFFMWVAPPRSNFPSRPPTEALGSFFLACGGLCFIFSTEEVTIAAMRRGRDDIMMFAVTAVAITCLAFCWVICIVGFQGWLKTHTSPGRSYHSAA
ncbi:cytoplasmic protein [Mycena capillaripes]|nr:cytoplasmic protein [Mycena capillaripes]